MPITYPGDNLLTPEQRRGVLFIMEGIIEPSKEVKTSMWSRWSDWPEGRWDVFLEDKSQFLIELSNIRFEEFNSPYARQHGQVRTWIADFTVIDFSLNFPTVVWKGEAKCEPKNAYFTKASEDEYKNTQG